MKKGFCYVQVIVIVIVSIIALLALMVWACTRSLKITGKMNDYVGIESNNRIEITRISVFEDTLSYGNRRGIYIIKDMESGKEFIGISGIGISELGSHTVGKSTAEDER